MGKFENSIKETLLDATENVSDTEYMKNRVDAEIKKRSEKPIIRKFSVKKVLAFSMAACLLLGVGVFAFGNIDALVSGFDIKTINSKTTNFAELPKEEGILGFQVQAVNQFSNGYTFKQMDVDKTFGMDEDGNILSHYSYYGLTIQYTKGDDSLYVNVYKPLEKKPITNSKSEKMIGNVNVYYFENTYKWVPEDYELTEEDKQNMLKPDYFISEGGDEPVSEEQVKNVCWYKDGVYYSILGYSLPLTNNEMFDMAEEIINSTK